MTPYEDALVGLKAFQRATVDYVVHRMFEEGQRRFLVADEVGLGKTLVAKGVVARSLERLEAEGVKRIDVVYICSNREIANQNIRKLNILKDEAFDRAERITLLPLYVGDLKRKPRARVKHNFISFTPGTMPDGGNSTGWARERALLYELLRDDWSFRNRKGPKRVLQATTRTLGSFEWEINVVRSMTIDEELKRRFLSRLRRVEKTKRLRARFDELATIFARRDPRGDENWHRNRLVSELRWQLARSCVEALEPDLIILDEFQRFRDLLDGETDAAELAQAMFDFQNARVLLLSATPYRRYTTSTDDPEHAHHADFVRTISFLFGADKERVSAVQQLLDDLRLEAMRSGSKPERIRELRQGLEAHLRSVMTRTERLAITENRGEMLDTVTDSGAKLASGDLPAFVSLRRATRELGNRRPGSVVEYWKSAPYLLNLMDTYELKRLVSEAMTSKEGRATLARALRGGAGLMDLNAVHSYKKIESANARLRTLHERVLEQLLWKLLWMPPTLPYYASPPPFGTTTATKQLVFSSWQVVPKAIGALTSYGAERRMIRLSERKPEYAGEGRAKLDRRLLDFKRSSRGDRSTGMPVLALLYPSFALAELADPLELRRQRASAGEPIPTMAQTVAWAREQVAPKLDEIAGEGGRDRRWYWAAPILLDAAADRKVATAWLDQERLPETWSEGKGNWDMDTRESSWRQHVEVARQVVRGEIELGAQPDDLAGVVAELAIAGPGVSVLRALARVAAGLTSVRDSERRSAAAAGAWAFRTLLNHPESIALIRSEVRPSEVGSDHYWRRALAYCVRGGLQAVLDEYVHMVNDLQGFSIRDPEAAIWLIAEQIRVSAGLKSAAIAADDISISPQGRSISIDRNSFTFRSRFAARYGEARDEAGDERTRAENLRDAFNSPFWPFVLATTSVGQEGLDFHTYCHAVVHWNLPSNPVDLEQREGRVHRYKGHAIRKNVAAAVSETALTTGGADPWEVLFDAAAGTDSDDLVPYWIYPGDALIERHVPIVPLSRDEARYRRLRRALALYRMVLGQPRQEDMVELLAERGADAEALAAELRIDLSPSPVRSSPRKVATTTR